MRRNVKLEISLWAIVAWVMLALTIVAANVNGGVENAPIENSVQIFRDSPYTPAGTGFIISKGRVITAKHVIDDVAAFIVIKYSNGVKEIIWKENFNMHPVHDLAVLNTTMDKGIRLRIADPNAFKIGEEIYMMGFPLSLKIRWMTVGIIASEITGYPNSRYSAQWSQMFLSDITIMPGNSGSPVFNSADEIVGVGVGYCGYTMAIIMDAQLLRGMLK